MDRGTWQATDSKELDMTERTNPLSINLAFIEGLLYATWYQHLASAPGLGRSPGEGNGYPLQYSCLENSTDRGAWQSTVPAVAKESNLTEKLYFTSLPGKEELCLLPH